MSEQQGSGRRRRFKSPKTEYVNFKTAKRPFSPSPKRHDYEKIAVTKSDKHSRCTYIHPETNKRCKLHLGIYPQFCHVHTMLVDNLFISKSHIKKAGNGLYVGAYSIKKGDIIGEYSADWNKVKDGEFYRRNGKDKDGEYKDVNSSYLFCDSKRRGEKEKDIQCWDSLDARATLMRNINDAHGSKFRNNCYFDVIKDKNGKRHVYVLASRNIAPFKELYLDYGESYF
jgi:hypothetical protein